MWRDVARQGSSPSTSPGRERETGAAVLVHHWCRSIYMRRERVARHLRNANNRHLGYLGIGLHSVVVNKPNRKPQ